MQLNNYKLSDRNNRPSVLSKVALECHFLNDGQYTDPFQISSVTIFNKSINFDPSKLLNPVTQLIDTSAVSGSVLMNFSNSSVFPTNVAFNASSYTGGQTASGIFRTGVGKYAVVLDGTIDLSGVINLDGMDEFIKNSASSTGEYIDIWTINMYEGSELQTVINNFSLSRGGLTTLTEPLMFKSTSKLVNNRVTLGSKVSLKIATEVTIENANISTSIKNLFHDTVITSGCLQIEKLNDAGNLPARVVVSSFTDTINLVTITSDNVLLLTWDTSLLSTHPQLIAGNFGSIQGIYQIRAKYNIFNETIITDPMYLTLS